MQHGGGVLGGEHRMGSDHGPYRDAAATRVSNKDEKSCHLLLRILCQCARKLGAVGAGVHVCLSAPGPQHRAGRGEGGGPALPGGATKAEQARHAARNFGILNYGNTIRCSKASSCGALLSERNGAGKHGVGALVRVPEAAGPSLCLSAC